MRDDLIEVIPIDEDEETQGDEGPSIEGVCDGAKEANLKYVLVLGETPDGEWYFASSEGDVYRAIHIAEQFKRFALAYGE